jgi:hypothetical protein
VRNFSEVVAQLHEARAPAARPMRFAHATAKLGSRSRASDPFARIVRL